MTAYELMIKANHYLIQGGKLTEPQKENIARQLLAVKSAETEARRFYSGVRFPNNIDGEGRRMYPVYYIPPHNGGKKYRTIFGQMPKTQIFSANMYELEILRLLHLLRPELPEVEHMVTDTLARLRTTCFGFADDGVGECFDASLVVLRFLAAAAPGQHTWIESRIENFNRHYAEKKRTWYCLWYYWLCLSELPFQMIKQELDKYKPVMLNWLEYKSYVMNSEQDKRVHPVLVCMFRNNISRYPEYKYIRERSPYVSEKDGRLHFDMANN